jgi:putative oxidoreductase
MKGKRVIGEPLDQRKEARVSGFRSSGRRETTLQQIRGIASSFLKPGGRILNVVAAKPAWGLAVLRLIAGGVFFESGYRKLFEIGIGGVSNLFGSMHLPLPVASAVLVTLLEVVGGIALLLGLFTRLTAALLAIDMLVASLVVYFQPAFFKAGIELPVTLLAVCIALALSEPGKISLDGTQAFAGATIDN